MKRILNIVLGLVVAASLTGCATGGVFGGKSGAQFKGTVKQVYDASLEVLKDEDMPVIRQETTNETAHIDSRYPNGTALSIAIRAVSPEYTATDISVGASGENYRAYDLMKKIESKI